MPLRLVIQPVLLLLESNQNPRPTQHHLQWGEVLPWVRPWHKHPLSDSIPHSNSNPKTKCRPSQTRVRLEQWARVDRNDPWVIQEGMLEDPVVQVVKAAIMHPWMEQEEQVERSLPPEQRHHPTRIGQLEKRVVLAALEGQKKDQGGPHPSVEPLGGQVVLQEVRVVLREDRVVKQEDPVESH